MSGDGDFRALIDARAASAPDAPFLCAPETGTVLSYGELRRKADGLASTFEQLGAPEGSTVAFMLPNGLAAAATFVGTMASGRVVVPVNLLAQDAHLDHTLAHAEPRIVVVSAEHAARVRAALARIGATPPLLEVDADRLDVPDAPPPRTKNRNPARPAMLMYTSGTTGLPKGVLLSHANMLHAGHTVAVHHGLSGRDRVLSSLPLYHINGQCIATVGTLCAGGSVVMPHRFSVSQWWPTVARWRPTWLNLVPTIVAYLLNAPDPTPGEREALRGVRFARSASAPLPPEQQRAFESRFGVPIVEAMGLTESASIAFCNPIARERQRLGSPGLPFGVEARVVDRGGRALADGERGEIQIRGPSVTIGYYRSPKAPDLTAAALRDGWLATGDLGYRDADGFYFITGRLKELIIKGGENIAPREIDEALLKHPAVLEAAAVGVPDPAYGQEILACIVVKPERTLSRDEIDAHCLRELGRYKCPRYVRFVDALPKGPSGKVQRMKLAEGFAP
ncbi:MAG: class I adenylate-forming enzyme family protein [Vicinamibacteria bacterium]